MQRPPADAAASPHCSAKWNRAIDHEPGVPARELSAPNTAFGRQKFPRGYIFLTLHPVKISLKNCDLPAPGNARMAKHESTIDQRARETAAAFGSIIRNRRK